MNNIDNKNDKSLFKKDNISLNELKALSLSTPNDAELGGKIRQMLWEKDDVERNEMGDEFVESCNVCGNDMNSNQVSEMDNVCKSCNYAKGLL